MGVEELSASVGRRWLVLFGAMSLAGVACAPAPLGSTSVGPPGSLRTSLEGVAEAAAPPPPAEAGRPSPPPGTEKAIAPPPEQMQGATKLQPPPALLQRPASGAAGGTWALVVGIDDYPGAKYDLRSAVNDADDVDRALGLLGVPPERRLVLRNGQATKRTLLSSVDWLTAHAGHDAVAVLFFAGHVRKVAPKTEAMVAADGRSVTDVELARKLARMAAKRMWIGMAACYGGGFTEALAPGRVLTGAAAADERAYENSGFGRSYMVEYMIRQGILEGRAPDTVQSAFAYARAQLQLDFPDRLPVQFDHGDGRLDLRPPGVARPSTAPAAAGPPPAEPPPPPSPTEKPEPGGQASTTTTSTTTPPPTTTTTTTRRSPCTTLAHITC